MDGHGETIADLVRLTLRDPRGAVRRIIGLGLPAEVLWQALLLVVVLSVIVAQLTALLTGTYEALQEDPLIPDFFGNPMMLGFVQGCLLVVMVFAVHWVGRTFGGTGQFEGAIGIVAWLQFLMVCLQVLQAVSGLLIPPLAGLIGVVGIVLFFWLLTQFLCALHGFESAGMVFVMILVTMLALTFALSILLAIVSLLFVGEMPDV